MRRFWSLLTLIGAIALVPPRPALAAKASPAAATLFAAPIIELAPLPTLVADGATPVELRLLVLDADGTPLSPAEAILDVEGATVSPVAVRAPGELAATLTPPLLDAPLQITLTLRLKLADKRKLKQAWVLDLVPPVQRKIAIAAAPSALVLGQDATANVEITVAGGGGGAEADVALRASVGALTNLTALGGGRFAALYTAPAGTDPGVAVLTVADKRDPTRTYGHARIALAAKRDLTVTVRKGSRALVTLAGREYGPVVADKSGKAKVAVVVPPGATQAEVASLTETDKQTSPLALALPTTGRVEWVPPPADLPADQRLAIPVRVVAVRPDGSPEAVTAPVLSASHGTLSPPQHEGDGVWVATLTPPTLAAVTPATLTATLPGDTAGRSVPLRFVPVRAAALTLRTSPAIVPAAAPTATLEARVTGPDGAGLPGRALGLVIDGAKAGPLEDRGNGDYAVPLTLSGRGPAFVLATAKAPATTNAPRSVVVLPTKERLLPDGLSSTMLTVLVVDEFGYPVADVPVALTLERGDGQLPKSARTDASGLAQVHFTAGRSPGFVQIAATAAGRRGAVGLWLLPEGVAPGVGVPAAGTAESLGHRAAWAPIVTALPVPRGP